MSANEEYVKRHLGVEWYPTFDGIETKYLEQCNEQFEQDDSDNYALGMEDYEIALRDVEKSLALKPDYDSAIYTGHKYTTTVRVRSYQNSSQILVPH